MMDETELLPRNKHDVSHIGQLHLLTDEEIAPIIPDLLEWVQDINWPVALPVVGVLKEREELVFPLVQDIMQGEDDMWQYWISEYLVPSFSLEHQQMIRAIIESKSIAMTDKQIVEDIVRGIARSFSGAESTKDWTKETIWFDAAPYACVGADRAKAVFDEAFGNLKSCEVEILDIRTRISGDSALVCSVQKWDTTNKDGSENPPFMMRQTDYLEKQGGVWKVLHEHTSPAQGWDGKIDE